MPLGWMTAGTIAFARSGRLANLVGAGVALGFAVWIKPYAVLWIPLLIAAVRTTRPRGRALGLLALGLAAPAVPVLAWIAWQGALPVTLKSQAQRAVAGRALGRRFGL